jgi:hypothetical protein
MTDEQRKSVALEYLKAFDNAGTTSTGASILDLFADDAQGPDASAHGSARRAADSPAQAWSNRVTPRP